MGSVNIKNIIQWIITVDLKNLDLNIVVEVEIERKVPMRAAVTIMSKAKLQAGFPNLSLSESNVTLKTYTAEKMTWPWDWRNRTRKGLVLTVVEGAGPSFLGRNWLNHLQYIWIGNTKPKLRCPTSWKPVWGRLAPSSCKSEILPFYSQSKKQFGQYCTAQRHLHIPSGLPP